MLYPSARRWQLACGSMLLGLIAVVGAACGSFGADGATATTAGDAGEAGSDGPAVAADAAATPEAAAPDAATDAGCIDVLGDGTGLTPAYQVDGTISATPPLETITFQARPPGGVNQEVRAHRAITMPPGATVLRFDADVEVSYPAGATWSGDAYFPVMGILAGTAYGTDPQANLTIGKGGGGVINMFANGTTVGTHSSTNTISFGTSGKRVTVSLLLDYAVPGLHVTGSWAGLPFTADLLGDVGPRPSGLFTIYVGGGAGGLSQPAVTLAFHKLCVAFTN